MTLILPWAAGSPDTLPPWPATVAMTVGSAATIDTTGTDWALVAVQGVGLRYIRAQTIPAWWIACWGHPLVARIAEVRGDLLIYPCEP